MRKLSTLLLVLTLALSVGLALASLSKPHDSGASLSLSPVAGVSHGSDGETIPVPFMNEGNDESGGSPITVFDSSMFTDDMEGGYPAWTSVDLAFDPATYWHLEPFHALSGDAFRCSNPGYDTICPAENGGYNNHWFQNLVFDAVNLSSATAPQFAFYADWSIEPPGGEPVGYDLWDTWNVWASIDGGTTWNVVTPSSPAYTGTSSYAFGYEFAMGPGIPGYGGSSAGPTTCIFPLTAYIGQSSVKVRVTFCSDPAFCSISDNDNVPHCDVWGVVVDSVRISDGASTLLSNDGVAGGWTPAPGPEAPDCWIYDSPESHSPSHSYRAVLANFLSRAIASYDVVLPAGYQQLRMNYWVWCDLPDADGPDTNNYLEDYYQIMSSTDNGVTWTQAAYDYGNILNGCNSLTNWCYRDQGLLAGAYIPIIVAARTDASLPLTVKVAFEITTDGDDDGGAGGTGLHIDDVEFVARRAQSVDLATQNMIVPLPTTVSVNRPWTFDFVNEGLSGINPVRGWLRYYLPDGSQLPPGGTDSVVISAGALNYGETRTITRTLTPSQAGPWQFRVIANATSPPPGEQDRTNDTTYSPATNTNPNLTMGVFVQRAGVYELGYNRRKVTNAYLQRRFIHVTPLADGVPAGDAANYDVLQLRVMWRYDTNWVAGATTEIKFWEEGADSFHTGASFYSFQTDIDSSETIGAAGIVRWWTHDLSTIPALHNRSGNFWVSVAALDTTAADPAPLPLGTSPAGPGDGHNYYGLENAPLTQSGGRVLIDVVIGQAVEDVVIHRGVTPSTDIILYWTAPPGASKYYVWRLTTPNQVYTAGTLLTPGGITTNTYTDVGRVAVSAKNFYVVITEY